MNAQPIKQMLSALAWLMIVFGASCLAQAQDREIAIVIDTSGSMSDNDKPRYTVQISKILAELLGPQDKLTVIGMKDSGSCSLGADMSLATELCGPCGRDIERFKKQVDGKIQYTTGTYFAAAIKTALQALSLDKNRRRMLLIIADSSGLDCKNSFRDLQNLHNTGALVAAINLGSTAGAFDSSPAFDFTAAALNSEQLIKAVAQVYQKFLGGRQIQTGRVERGIEFELPDFVSKAFLVVAADGLIPSINPSPGNPAAKQIDFQHGAGQTVGLDKRTRAYRILRLGHPLAGMWRFSVPGLTDSAGWMLIQETALGVRFITPPILAKGVITPIEIELFDENTGKRLTDTPPGIKLTLKIDGRDVDFSDDGRNHDKESNDGILTGELRIDTPGKQTVDVHMETEFVDRAVTLETEVVEAAWKLQVDSPHKTELDAPTLLKVTLEAIGDISQLTRPEKIEVDTGYNRVILRDDGSSGDIQAHDSVYTGTWLPGTMGILNPSYRAVPATATRTVNKEIEVLGYLEFGAAVPIDFGETHGNHPDLPGSFDLSGTTVKGSYEITLTGTFDKWGSVLEILLDNEWQALTAAPLTLKLEQHGPRTWPVRIRTGRCPASSPAEESFRIIAKATNSTGDRLQLATPIKLIIHPPHWFTCWWPVIAVAMGILAGVFVGYGFIAPSRFSSRLGVVLSPEEDISEGFFHPVRGQRGTGSGFYRDARAYIGQDFRISGRAGGALVRLRAEGKRVRLLPVGTVWRQTADGDWERLGAEETGARFGTVYRDDVGGLFFEIRNG